MRRTTLEIAPLIGRADELDRIMAALGGVAPASFVLAGPAGVGKTRLAAEVAKAAGSLDYNTAHVASTMSAASFPFGPFAPLLPVSDLARDDLLGLLRQASEALMNLAGKGRRLLLVVDDAHLLDDGSAALVHQLVRASSCSLLASVRTPAPTPDSITALWKDELSERIDLGPLSQADIEELAAKTLGGPVAGTSVQWLWSTSRGNALYLRELVVGALESGSLVDDNGIWTLRLPLTAPDRLVELVASRLSSLAPDTVKVIELLAIGEPLGLKLLEGVASAEALEEAEDAGLMEVRRDGQRLNARLAQPVYGEVLRQRLPQSRLHRLLPVLAALLEGTGARRREDVLRIARWQLDGGGPGDPEILGRAARLASSMFDRDLSARLARAAYDSGGGVAAGLALGEAEFSLGRHQEAETVLAALVPLCSTDMEIAQVANARAYNLGVLMANPAAASAVLKEALWAMTDVSARLRIVARLASKLLFEGDPEAALAAAEELLASEEDMHVYRGAYASSTSWALLGRGDRAVEVARRGFEAHRRAKDSNQLPEVQLIGSVLGHAAVGRLAEAEADAKTGYEACLAVGDNEGVATFALLRGWVYVEQGLLGRAAKNFLEGASINREIRDDAALRWCLGGLALAEGMAGRAVEAAAATSELDDLPPTWMTIFEAELIKRGRAWASVAAGDVSLACDMLTRAAEPAALDHQWVAEAHLLHDVARLGEPASVAPRLADLAIVIDGDLSTAFARHTAAMVRRSAGQLEEASLGFEAVGAWLLAAEARSAAGVIYQSEGTSRKAKAAERRTAELVALCGDVRTPGLPSGGAIDQLTRREKEVATLAAAGVSSKDIAARLFLSIRTVDNHLHHAYTKLGVTSREELALALASE